MLESPAKNKKIEKKENEMVLDLLSKYPHGYSIDEIIEAELPNGSDFDREVLRNSFNEYFQRKAEKETEERQKRVEEEREYEIRKEKEDKKMREQEEWVRVKDTFRKSYVDDYIYRVTRGRGIEGKPVSYFVIGAANELIKQFFHVLGKKSSKDAIEEAVQKLLKSYEKENPTLTKRFNEFYNPDKFIEPKRGYMHDDENDGDKN